MRVISGRAKGIKLVSPSRKNKGIRPTSDRCREALFSILGSTISKATVLDLYAGTGALGLEALSRGAQSAVFIDDNPLSLTLIRRNANLIMRSFAKSDDTPHISIIKGKLPKALFALARPRYGEQVLFDIIFLDPPYGAEIAKKTLQQLDISNLSARDGIIVAEDSTKATLPHRYNNFILNTVRSYGDTCLWVYQKTHAF